MLRRIRTIASILAIALPPLSLLLSSPIPPFRSVAAAAPAEAPLVLNEVLYDPLGEDAGAEFVELWNRGDGPLSLEGVTIEAGDGARPGIWSLLFTGAAADTAPPHGPFLVAGSRLLGALQNGPDAVRLLAGGVPLDLLGYGALADPAQYEGAPAPDVASGASLARRADGEDRDRNDEDWEAAIPTPGRANRPPRAVRFAGPPAIVPEAAWPGETPTAEIEVRNAGALPLEAGAWNVSARLRPRRAEGEPAPWGAPVAAAGPALATGASARWSAPLPVGDAGPIDVRFEARIAAAPGDASLGDSATAAARVGPGPVLVHEIAFRDAGAGEWVELLAASRVESWGGYALGDATGALRTLRPLDPAHDGAPEGALRVAVADPSAFRARFSLPDSLLLVVEGGWAPLNDAASGGPWADVVRIVASDGAPSDAVPYAGAWSARGGSLERLAATLPSDAPGTWSETTDPRGGTPGARNSLAAPGLDGAVAPPLLAAPSRVLRRGPGDAGGLVIEIGAAAAARNVRLVVHDLRGRARRILADGARLNGAGAVVWDGLDDDGRPVPPGLYVVRLDATATGEAPRRASVAIAVSAAGASR